MQTQKSNTRHSAGKSTNHQTFVMQVPNTISVVGNALSPLAAMAKYLARDLNYWQIAGDLDFGADQLLEKMVTEPDELTRRIYFDVVKDIKTAIHMFNELGDAWAKEPEQDTAVHS